MSDIIQDVIAQQKRKRQEQHKEQERKDVLEVQELIDSVKGELSFAGITKDVQRELQAKIYIAPWDDGQIRYIVCKFTYKGHKVYLVFFKNSPNGFHISSRIYVNSFSIFKDRVWASDLYDHFIACLETIDELIALGPYATKVAHREVNVSFVSLLISVAIALWFFVSPTTKSNEAIISSVPVIVFACIWLRPRKIFKFKANF